MQVSSFNQLYLLSSIFRFCWCIKNNNQRSESSTVPKSLIVAKSLIYSWGVAQALGESLSVRFYDKYQ